MTDSEPHSNSDDAFGNPPQEDGPRKRQWYDKPEQSMSPVARGWLWANRITGVGLEMILPIIGGYFLDQWLGTTPWIMLALLPIGFIIGLTHLIKIANADASSSGSRHKS